MLRDVTSGVRLVSRVFYYWSQYLTLPSSKFARWLTVPFFAIKWMQISKAHVCKSLLWKNEGVIKLSCGEPACIPCILLNEPLEVHNVAALKWWLLSWHKASIVLKKATSYATPAIQWPWWAQVSKVGFPCKQKSPFSWYVPRWWFFLCPALCICWGKVAIQLS